MELCALLRILPLVVLLYIPRYFELKAKEALSGCQASHHGESKDEESFLTITFPPPAYSVPGRRALSDDESLLLSTSQPIRRFKSIVLESAWNDCIDHWRKLWRIIASVAFTIVVGSSALLQMPGTGDPLTRSFVFLFILRLVSALLSAGALLYYFSKSHFHSGNFALFWYKKVKRYQQSCFYMPWTIVALPAIAISWGAIFMLVAVFLSVWGDGLKPNPATDKEIHPLTIMSLRVIITATSVFDVGWVLWLVMKLRAFDKAVSTVQDSAA